MLKHFLSKLIPDSFKQEFKIKLGAPHMFWSVANLKRNGLDAKTIIDIGAYKGEWSEEVLKIYPDAEYLLIEASPDREVDLKRFANTNKTKKIAYDIALLGSKSGEDKSFSLTDTASSALEEHSRNNYQRIVLKTSTLDEIVAKRALRDIGLIKLDVQGYEIEVLKGGCLAMGMAEAILMEVSILDLHKNVPLIKDVLCFMDQYNFVVYDICSLSTRRPKDRALWQTDLLFVKKDSKFRINKNYY